MDDEQKMQEALTQVLITFKRFWEAQPRSLGEVDAAIAVAKAIMATRP